MKSQRTLPFVLAVSFLAADALNGAEAPKKPASTPAGKVTKAGSKSASADKEATADKPSADAKAAATPSAPVADAIPNVVAVVEGMEIKKADLDTAIESILAQQGRSAADMPAEQKPMIYRMVLDDVIIDKLIAKRSEGIKIEDADVDGMIAKLKQNFGTEEEFKAQVEKMGQTIEKVRENIRTNLRQQRWVEDQIKGKDEVTDAEVEKFYKENTEQFKQPDQVRASHILLMVPQDAKPEVVVEKEKAAKAILERVKKGEDFAKLAKELSEDPSAKQNSGDLDFFTKDKMVPEFAEAAFKLKDGEISPEPVRSQFGYHIIKVTGHKAAETIAFEQAKPQIQGYLKNQKKQAEVEKVVKEMRAKAEVKINLPEVKMPPMGLPGQPPAGAPGEAPAAAPAPAEPAASAPVQPQAK